MLATDKNGRILPLAKAQIQVPILRTGLPNVGALSVYTITLNVLPELSDSKAAEYPDEPITGRSFPIKVFSHSGNRTIGLKCTFLVQEAADIQKNWQNLRALQSAVYTDEDIPQINATNQLAYLPPPICKVRIGFLLTAQNDGWLPVLIRQCTPTYPTDVAWDPVTYLPHKFEVDLQMEAVFANTQLPGQQRIFRDVPR